MPSPSTTHQARTLLLAFLIITNVSGSGINGYKSSTKLDQTEDQISKCGGACTPGYYFSSPPPPKKPHRPTGYCPPPPVPYSGFVYITGPPASLYPVDQTYYNSGGAMSMMLIWSAVAAQLMAAILMLW